MDNKCEYRKKCNVSKVLIIAVISFIVVCSIMILMMFSYHQKVNENFKNYISKTSEIISGIKIENQNKKQILISDELLQAISKINQNEYENFLRSYYESQNNWLNVWLTILALLLGLLGLIIPLCFLKFYESKKEEFNIVIREVEKKKETMTKDIEEVKKYVEKAKESEKRVEVNRLLVSAMRESSKKNYSEALERINKALDIDSKNMNLFYAKADILSDLHRFSEAVPLYETVIKNRPSVGVYNNYANTLADMKNFDKSIEMFSKAIAISPKEDYMLFSNRGMTFMTQGNTIRALEDFKKVLQLSPEKNSLDAVLYNIIECCLKNRDFKNSLIYLKRFMQDMKEPFIYDDDKPLWLGLLKDSLEQKEVTEIANLINDLKIKPRQVNK